jgi:hypothetical protein
MVCMELFIVFEVTWGMVAECCKVGSTRCARLKSRRRGLVVVVLKAARRVVPGSRPASELGMGEV